MAGCEVVIGFSNQFHLISPSMLTAAQHGIHECWNSLTTTLYHLSRLEIEEHTKENYNVEIALSTIISSEEKIYNEETKNNYYILIMECIKNTELKA